MGAGPVTLWPLPFAGFWSFDFLASSTAQHLHEHRVPVGDDGKGLANGGDVGGHDDTWLHEAGIPRRKHQVVFAVPSLGIREGGEQSLHFFVPLIVVGRGIGIAKGRVIDPPGRADGGGWEPEMIGQPELMLLLHLLSEGKPCLVRPILIHHFSRARTHVVETDSP